MISGEINTKSARLGTCGRANRYRPIRPRDAPQLTWRNQVVILGKQNSWIRTKDDLSSVPNSRVARPSVTCTVVPAVGAPCFGIAQTIRPKKSRTQRQL